MVGIEEIRRAAARLQGQVLNTPCVESRTLSEIVGAQVFLKFENLQFTASFKERGARNALRFSFQDLIVLRTAQSLVAALAVVAAAGQPARRVRSRPADRRRLAVRCRPWGPRGRRAGHTPARAGAGWHCVQADQDRRPHDAARFR